MILKINIFVILLINLIIIPINIFSNNYIPSLDSVESYLLSKQIDRVIYPPGYISLLYALDIIPNFQNILSLGVATGVGITLYTFVVLRHYFSLEIAVLFTVIFNSPIFRLFHEFYYTSYSLQIYCLITMITAKVYLNYLEKNTWLDWELGIVVLVSNMFFIHQIHFFTLILIITGLIFFWDRKYRVLYFILYQLIIFFISIIIIFSDHIDMSLIDVISENIQYNWKELVYLNITKNMLVLVTLFVVILLFLLSKIKQTTWIKLTPELFLSTLTLFLFILSIIPIFSDQNFSSERDRFLLLYLTFFILSLYLNKIIVYRNGIISLFNIFNLIYLLNFPIRIIS